MPSSLFSRIRVRFVDAALQFVRRPNRIDPTAAVSRNARLTATSIFGPARIGDYAALHEAVLSGPVSIGRNSSLWGPGIYVLAKRDPIEIGNFCSIARDVSIHGYFHDAQRISTHFIGRNVLGRDVEDEIVTRGVTRIGHDVWIGAGVHVMAGVTIGNGAIIGAGSVVSRDIPPYAVAVGSPARVLRFRFDESTITRVQDSCWWEWSHEKIRARADLFVGKVTADLLDRNL